MIGLIMKRIGSLSPIGTFIVMLLFSSVSLGQQGFYLKSGFAIGQTLSATTSARGLYTDLLKDQNGIILSYELAAEVIIGPWLLSSQFDRRFQNWVLQDYAEISNISFSLAYLTLNRKNVFLAPYIGAGYFISRNFNSLKGRTTFFDNDTFLYAIVSKYTLGSESGLNFHAGLLIALRINNISNFYINMRYIKGYKPFVFMDLEAEHVQLGPGSSKAQYDGSALLFTVSYGVNLLGLRQRLKEKMR